MIREREGGGLKRDTYWSARSVFNVARRLRDSDPFRSCLPAISVGDETINEILFSLSLCMCFYLPVDTHMLPDISIQKMIILELWLFLESSLSVGG